MIPDIIIMLIGTNGDFNYNKFVISRYTAAVATAAVDVAAMANSFIPRTIIIG